MLFELALATTVLMTLTLLLFPIFSRAQPLPENDRQRQRQVCISNVKQLTLACCMYVQDHNSQYPGIDKTSWVSKIDPYLGGNPEMFECPADPETDEGEVVSYGLSGLLVRGEGGMGVKESQVISPSEVGALCDAAPSQPYPNGRVVGGGGQRPVETAVQPEPRHDGIVIGYCDGHAKYFPGKIDLHDGANGAARALYHAAPLGLIDNPTAMMPAGVAIDGLAGTVVVGGEYAARPFLLAAAQMSSGDYFSMGFKGQLYTMGRPQAAWVWGAACTGPDAVAPRAIAYDAVCIVVARGSKIPALPPLVNETYVMSPAEIRELFEIGYQQNNVQVYRFSDARSSTNTYVKKVIGNADWGRDEIEVMDDAEMIEKVANDPYAIGYCSSAFADPDRVVILAPVIDGRIHVWPQSDPQHRWVMPAFAESDWPWKRSLDVEFTPDELGTGIAAALRAGALVKQGLYPGPLFTWGYWPGNY